MLNNIEAVIFDLDGTLLNSMHIWHAIDEEFLGSREIIPPSNLSRIIEGMSLKETALWFKTNFSLVESLEEIQNIWHAMAYDKYKNHVDLKEGALDFLKLLKKKQYKIGIATSNSRKLVEVCLTSLDITHIFDTIVTGDDIKKGKPSPEIYLYAASNLNVEPANCLIFEDIPSGILSGINANMRTCAVYDKYSDILTLQKREMADYYIDNFKDLLHYVS